MSLTHDIIKIKYVELGYLPDYPYHLISDEEMCDAFISEDHECYFYDNYPCLDDALKDEYQGLVDDIKYWIDELKNSKADEYMLPDWVYSYMLGSTISVNSDKRDIHDLLVLLHLDNIDDIFTPEASSSCLTLSEDYINKLPRGTANHRHPSMFGEPHVIKLLRLIQISEMVGD